MFSISEANKKSTGGISNPVWALQKPSLDGDDGSA